MSGTVAIVLFVVGLVAAIMLHEWGHFVTARRFGMRADRFFLGFGPTLWSRRIGETEYGVKAIPAGGFVRIKGMTPADQRLAPVTHAVLSEEAVTAARRHEEGGFEGDGHLPGEHGVGEAGRAPIPETTWSLLSAELERRGTPRAVRERIVRRTRDNLGELDDLGRARALLTEVIVTEVTDEQRIGDLRHRLLRGDEDRFFGDRPAWQRAVVLVAGSAMHYVIAVVLLLAGFLLVPQPTDEVTSEASEVVAGSPADEAGLEAGDRIVAVDGAATDDFAEIRDAIRGQPGERIELEVVRDGERRSLELTPAEAEDPETGETIGQIGYAPTVEMQRLSVGDALYQTFVGPASVPSLTVASAEGLVRVFSPEGIGALLGQLDDEGPREADENTVASPIGIASATGQGVAASGVFFLIGMLVSINVFVGLFNILPLPPLDGGHLAVLGVERAVNGVRRRRGRPTDFTVDPRAIAAVAIPFLAVLGTVFFAVVWLDVTNPLQLR